MSSENEAIAIELPYPQLAAFCRRNAVRELALFGSALGAEFGAGSDIDLLVEFAPDSRIGFLDLARMQRELAHIFGRAIDLVPKDGLKPAIRGSVLANTRVIYAE
jgi:predicted nucleotidyltransferase